MDNASLRRVQLVQLAMLREVRRVCEENHIKFFLDSGTCLGAVRHGGFIPWDDDLDIGMLREDYDRFCTIAADMLSPEYELQTWDDGTFYGVPFAKIRKLGTVYAEAKAPALGRKEIYIDIFPYDLVPEDNKDFFSKYLAVLYCIILAKSKHRPWIDNGKTDWKTRLGLFPYQVIALFLPKRFLIKKYDEKVRSVKSGDLLYCNWAGDIGAVYDKEWFEETVPMLFEGEYFPVIRGYQNYLETTYGDYMTPPPENERGNMHQIVDVELGEGGVLHG